MQFSNVHLFAASSPKDDIPLDGRGGGIIAYSVTQNDGTNVIYYINADGTGQTAIPGLTGRPLSPTWSPDAARIAYYNHQSEQNWVLNVMDPDGTNNLQLTGTEENLDWSPSWATDGSKILFTRSYMTPSWHSEIWSINPDGSNEARLGTIEGQGADYSPDDTKIVYFTYSSTGGDICTINPDGTNNQQLTTDPAEDWWPNWSSDGSKIVFQSKRNGNFEIYKMNADGSNQTRLTFNTAADEEPRWSSDDTKIVFTSLQDGHYEIYSMNADGTEQTRLTNTEGQAINPDWKPLTEYLGQTPPDSLPKRFGTGEFLACAEWQWHGTPSFSPDGQEMFFAKYNIPEPGTSIWYSHRVNNRWTAPELAPFSQNSYDDNNPVFVGNDTLYFKSQRTDFSYVYRVTKNENGTWSGVTPLNLVCPNGYYYGNQFSLAANGNIYGELNNLQTNNEDLYLWTCTNGTYGNPQLITELASPDLDFCPYVDPAENYIIFCSNRPGGFGDMDLYISTKQTDNTWSVPQNMGSVINELFAYQPKISPDGLYFFYNTIKTEDLGINTYWVKADFYLNPISNTDNTIPSPAKDFSLQNYPNPFNPQTTISFSLQETGKINLSIYNIKGQKVKTLLNGNREVGSHTVVWNGKDSSDKEVSSGIYFYKLSVPGNRSEIKKALLMK